MVIDQQLLDGLTAQAKESPRLRMNLDLRNSDGAPRKVKLLSGRGITFVKTAPRNLAYTNRLAMLLTFALREIGEGNVTEEHKQHIAGLLKNEDRAAVERDFPLMPAWVQVLIMKLYCKLPL